MADTNDLTDAAEASEEVVSESEDKVDWEAKATELSETLAKNKAASEKVAVNNERNLRRQSSSLQNQINTEKARATAVEGNWADRFHAEKMSGMEDAEAARYENTLLEEKLVAARAETSEVRHSAQEARSAAGYIQHFGSLGINPDRLNTSGSLQDLADSGYEAEREDQAGRLVELEDAQALAAKQQETIKALQAGDPDPNAIAESKGDITPPRVAVTTGETLSGTRTELQAREAAKQYFSGELPTMEQLYRAVETKQLPASVLPGLEGMPRNNEN